MPNHHFLIWNASILIWESEGAWSPCFYYITILVLDPVLNIEDRVIFFNVNPIFKLDHELLKGSTWNILYL